MITMVTATCPQYDQDVTRLSLQELFQRWQEAHTFDQAAGNAPIWEILRRAAAGNQDAWCYYYQAYSSLVDSWTVRYAPSLDKDDRQSIANAAWAKFARQVTPAKLTRFPAYLMILQYLKQCVHTTAIDTLRERQQELIREEGLEAAAPIAHVDGTLEGLWIEEITRAMFQALPNAQDQLLADLILLQGMPVREVCALHPDLFSEAKMVYGRVRAIRERLQRDPQVLLLLGRQALHRRRHQTRQAQEVAA